MKYSKTKWSDREIQVSRHPVNRIFFQIWSDHLAGRDNIAPQHFTKQKPSIHERITQSGLTSLLGMETGSI